MKIRLFLLTIILLFTVVRCIHVRDYKKMTYYQKSFDNTKIRMDGFFSCQRDDDSSYTHFITFYKDGTFFNNGHGDEMLIDGLFRKKLWKLSHLWGCYVVEGDTLKVQTFWYKDLPFVLFWHVTNIKWYIHNDSTIQQIEYDHLKKKEVLSKNVYLFNSCINCKPDSMNFIKKSKKMQRIVAKREQTIKPKE